MSTNYLYYCGCFLMALFPIAILIIVHFIKRVIENQKEILMELQEQSNTNRIIKERSIEIDNSVYYITQRIANREEK